VSSSDNPLHARCDSGFFLWKGHLASSPSKVGTLVPTLLEYSSSVSIIFDQCYTTREASIAIVLKRVVKSFLSGRTLGRIALMTVTAVRVVEFATQNVSYILIFWIVSKVY